MAFWFFVLAIVYPQPVSIINIVIIL